MAITISDTAFNAMLTELNSQIGASCKILVYDGTQPSAGAAPSGNTLLAELTGNTTFGTVSGRQLTANAVTGDSSGNASGTPTWFRITTSADAYVIDGTAAVGSGDMNFNAAITSGAAVDISSIVIGGGNA